MKTFKVTVESYDIIIYYDNYEIVAESEKEAKKLALSGDFHRVSDDVSYCEGDKNLIKDIVDKDFEPSVLEVKDITDKRAEEIEYLQRQINLRQGELDRLKEKLAKL